MTNTLKDRLLSIPVSPTHLEISDIGKIKKTAGGLIVNPTHYKVSIFISGLVLQRLIRWGIREGYVVTSGSFTIPNRTKREQYNVSSKKESDAT